MHKNPMKKNLMQKNLMDGVYLGDMGEAGEPRHLSQCSGPEYLFVSLFIDFVVC